MPNPTGDQPVATGGPRNTAYAGRVRSVAWTVCPLTAVLLFVVLPPLPALAGTILDVVATLLASEGLIRWARRTPRPAEQPTRRPQATPRATTGRPDHNPTNRRAAGYVRLGAGIALTLLAAITAVISYQHGLDVTHRTGTKGWVAYLVPLVADLMIFASSLALLDAAQHDSPRPRLAVASLTFGILATIAMNVASGWHQGYGGALVSALAPLALVLSYETLMGMVRRARERTPEPVAENAPEATASQPETCGHELAFTGPEAALTAYLHRRDCIGDEPSIRQVAADFGVNRNKLSDMVRDHDQPPADDTEPEPTETLPPSSLQTANGHLISTGATS